MSCCGHMRFHAVISSGSRKAGCSSGRIIIPCMCPVTFELAWPKEMESPGQLLVGKRGGTCLLTVESEEMSSSLFRFSFFNTWR
jgi:hypothetical protein